MNGGSTTMKESTTITFLDAVSTEETVAIVRYDQSNVVLCLSLKSDGDMEVVMKIEDARKLLEALKKAVAQE